MRYSCHLRVGPARFRIGSAWPQPIAALRDLYRDYPDAADIPDFTVRLGPTRPWRRWLRPSVAIAGDFSLPDAAPLPLVHGLLAAEMAMNLQMALGWRRHLLLHAGAVARGDRALILTGVSGAGKSTLTATLGERGWRFLGDEFVLIDPDNGLATPFPRAVSLKNAAIPAMAAQVGDRRRFGPLLTGTPKGTIRHLRPDAESIAAMDTPARPALLLFPRFGHAEAVRPMDPAETFLRLTQASTNYVALGEQGFAALTRLIGTVPVRAFDYPNGATGVAMAEALWDEIAG